MKTKLIILLVVIITITACRKYPEGGLYVLTNMARKIEGSYTFEHYYVNGIDSVDYYFKNNNSSTEIRFVVRENGGPDFVSFCSSLSRWGISKDEKVLEISRFDKDELCIKNLEPLINMNDWDILKVKDGDLFLETNMYNGKHYRIELKK